MVGATGLHRRPAGARAAAIRPRGADGEGSLPVKLLEVPRRNRAEAVRSGDVTAPGWFEDTLGVGRDQVHAQSLVVEEVREEPDHVEQGEEIPALGNSMALCWARTVEGPQGGRREGSSGAERGIPMLAGAGARPGRSRWIPSTEAGRAWSRWGTSRRYGGAGEGGTGPSTSDPASIDKSRRWRNWSTRSRCADGQNTRTACAARRRIRDATSTKLLDRLGSARGAPAAPTVDGSWTTGSRLEGDRWRAYASGNVFPTAWHLNRRARGRG